jgi:cyclic pyranopterin phosphate synthase
MEELAADSVADFTLYEMLKAISKEICLYGLRLLAKSGGKSGDYRAESYYG